MNTDFFILIAIRPLSKEPVFPWAAHLGIPPSPAMTSCIGRVVPVALLGRSRGTEAFLGRVRALNATDTPSAAEVKADEKDPVHVFGAALRADTKS